MSMEKREARAWMWIRSGLLSMWTAAVVWIVCVFLSQDTIGNLFVVLLFFAAGFYLMMHGWNTCDLYDGADNTLFIGLTAIAFGSYGVFLLINLPDENHNIYITDSITRGLRFEIPMMFNTALFWLGSLWIIRRLLSGLLQWGRQHEVSEIAEKTSQVIRQIRWFEGLSAIIYIWVMITGMSKSTVISNVIVLIIYLMIHAKLLLAILGVIRLYEKNWDAPRCEEKPDFRPSKSFGKKEFLPWIAMISALTVGIVVSAFTYTSAVDFMQIPCGEDKVLLGTYQGDRKWVTIPSEIDGKEVIGLQGTFYYGSQRKVTIPEGIHIIGDKSFLRCNYLESIKLPDSLVEIGDYAFYDSNLKKVSYQGHNLRRVGYDPFGDTRWIYASQGEADTVYLGNALICQNITGKTMVIDKKTVAIAGKAIQEPVHQDGSEFGYDDLEEVYFPEGITELGANFLEGCSNLKKVHIPKSVTYISDYVGNSFISYDFTICGAEDSEAEKFAEDRGYAFVIEE